VTEKDENGNALYISDIGVVALKLKGEKGRIRMIGLVVDSSRGVRVYKKFGDQSYFRKLGAFGFCHEAIQMINPDIIKVVCLTDKWVEKGSYTMGINRFRELMDYFNFKEKGFELQVFVSVDAFMYRR
jgi:hypothetical protein